MTINPAKGPSANFLRRVTPMLEDSFESVAFEVVEDSFEGLAVEIVKDSVESLAVEVVENSFKGLAMEIVEDSFEGVDVIKDADENKVKSKRFDESIDHGSEIVVVPKGFPTINLNKIPEDHSHYHMLLKVGLFKGGFQPSS
ncbi:hypothetical protein JHK85_001267 [Glycine max]|nr:hypothetical protein JHK85_001267 [Glycine max]